MEDKVTELTALIEQHPASFMRSTREDLRRFHETPTRQIPLGGITADEVVLLFALAVPPHTDMGPLQVAVPSVKNDED